MDDAPMHPDMSWVGVLEHHARRTPDKPLAIFGDETVTYGEMADARGRAGGRAARTRRRRRRRRRAALVQLHRVPRDDLRRELPRRDRDADQLAARRAGAAVHPRPLRSACAGVRRVARRSRERGDEGHGARPRPRLHRADRHPTGGRRSPISGAASSIRAARARGRRRHPPADVHLGNHRAPEGRDDHARQPGVEEPRAHRRVRLHQRRSRARVRPAVSRRRARPHDHLAHRRGRDHDHPSRVRRGRRRRRDRAVARDHRVARAGDGQRDHGAARHRSSATSRRCGWSSTVARRCRSRSSSGSSGRSRRRGSPTRTASPRRSRATRSSTATAS